MKIYLIGFMGSGKSYWGRMLSEKLGLRFFDLDEQITEQAGKPITAIFAEAGEEAFREMEKEMLHLLTETHDSFIMATGGGTPCFFNNIEYMNESGITVWFNTPQDVLYQRLIKEKDHRPLVRELGSVQLKAYISKKCADRRMYYEQAQLRVDEDPVQIESLIELLFHA